MFSYFTILSVLLALVYFSALVISAPVKRSAAESPLWRALANFKGGVTLGVTITMTVCHFLLAPVIFEMVGHKPFTPNDVIVHYAIPLMVILDWLLFDPKPPMDRPIRSSGWEFRSRISSLPCFGHTWAANCVG